VLRPDLATADGVQALASAVLDRYERVDALVNNVGAFPARSSFLEVTDEQWRTGFEVNVLSAIRLTRALLPRILAGGGGAIVNIGSVNARLPFPSVVDYSAHKAALANLTKSLSEEFAPRGVRVNSVAPGPVRTPAWTDAGGNADAMAAATGETREQVLDQGVPAALGVSLGRMGEASEVADLVAFLLGDRAQWITGTDLVIDGGLVKTL
jgi:NAD(P)-dependent dehydrogenase (short-subunit alcohol dehydrogenase family)